MKPPVCSFTDYAGMVDALRTIKDHLQLSNATLDTLCNFTGGQTDKLLGPSGARGFTPLTLNAMLWALALRVEITIDVGRAAEMQAFWEARCAPNVRPGGPTISKVLVERAKPLVLRDFSKLGNDARKLLLPREKQVKIARKAARARARLPKAMRSEISRKGWLKRGRKNAVSKPEGDRQGSQGELAVGRAKRGGVPSIAIDQRDPKQIRP